MQIMEKVKFLVENTMNKVIVALLLFPSASFSQNLLEIHKQNETPTYEQTIQFYKELAQKSDYASLQSYGESDIGKPINLLVIDAGKNFKTRDKNKPFLLINNGIHPGEPCGVNASIIAANYFIKHINSFKNITIGIIPIYNIGGALNRSCCSRANQNGPKEYGFRGNAKNLDLNRDFVKCDSKNAFAFTEIFQHWMPDIFLDTHTSNGADYQYVMTLLTTQLDKLNPSLSAYTKEKLLPFLYTDMEKKGYPMVPYVHSINQIPDNGIMDYLETPRYATGYSTLLIALVLPPKRTCLNPLKKGYNQPMILF